MEDFNKEKNSSENGFTPDYTPLDPWAKNAQAEGAGDGAPQTAAGAEEVREASQQGAPGTQETAQGEAQKGAVANESAKPSFENNPNASFAEAHTEAPAQAPRPDPMRQTTPPYAEGAHGAPGAQEAPGAQGTQGVQGTPGFAPGQQPYGYQAQHSPFRPQPQPQQAPQYPPQHPHQPQNGFSVNRDSGEYRYVPPFAQGYDPHAQQRFTPPQPPKPEKPAKEKKHKSGRRFSTAAIVLIVCATVLLSFGSGMAGALIVGNTSQSSGGTSAVNGSSDSGAVIYKSPVTVDEDEDAEGLSGLCALVSDSVVEISTEFQKSYGNFQYVNGGAGSGVIISADGYIITNNHVITDESTGKLADSVKVRLTDSSEYDAKVVGHDSDSDIAVIKIEAKNLSPAVLGSSDSLKVGEQVIAVGNPLGELGGTVTGGIISATNREISVDNNMMNLIQIDAAINPGNSGGGLFNMKGELIGIVNAKSTGSDVEGLGFAIPIDEAGRVAEELISNGYVSGKSYVGISLTDITDSFTAYYYFKNQSTGVYITQVQEGYNDGVLQYGDRIAAIDGTEISSSADVKEIVKEHKVGDEMTFTVSRNGKMTDVTVKCYEYVPQSDVSFGSESAG